MKTIAAIAIASILPVVSGSQEPRQSVQNERIEVKLSTDRSEYKPGGGGLHSIPTALTEGK
jgi:hypothetical protein